MGFPCFFMVKNKGNQGLCMSPLTLEVSFEVANGSGPYRSFEYKSFEYRFQGPIVAWKNSGSFGNEICYCQLPNISDHRRLSGVTGICKGPFFGHLNGDNSGKNTLW